MENTNKKYIEKYYTSVGYFERKFDAISRQMGFKANTPDEYAIWKNSLLNELRNLTGINTCESCDLNPEITERVELDGYSREKVLLQTEPGIIMPIYVLIPDNMKKGEKRPAVLALHGHLSGGKCGVAGRSEISSEVEDVIKGLKYAYGVQLVKQGFLVFCPDARGFGERGEKYLMYGVPRNEETGDLMEASCYHLNSMGVPLGQTVAGMMAWDNMRLLDYIESRDDCDSGRIGCAGLSGGGQQTLWLAAFDERIKCAVISGYFYGFKSALLKYSYHCSCNYVPHLWEKADMGDIGALIAPRPLLIETGNADGLNGEEGLLNVYPQVEITRKAYGLFSSGEKLYHHVFEGDHEWNGEKAIPWLKKWLME